MQKTVILVYRTDVWHTYKSRDLIGVCTDRDETLKVVEQAVEQDGLPPLSEEQIDLLNRLGQTQGYHGRGEFQTEQYELNTIL
jgi:hypothetical protein